MKHDQFIELLNLYLDGEISQQESADLEREITQNPERRKIYRQYCQMQRACNMLSEKFRDAAETPAAAGDNVVPFPSRPAAHWARTFSMVASGAVAACFVFIVVRTGLSPSTPGSLDREVTPAIAANPVPLFREQQIPVTTLAASENPSYLRVNSANPGDFAAAAGAVPASAQAGRQSSLFLAVPPLPNHHHQPMMPVAFPQAAPGLQLEYKLENAIQFPR